MANVADIMTDPRAGISALREARLALHAAIDRGAIELQVVLDEVEDLLVEAIRRERRPAVEQPEEGAA